MNRQDVSEAITALEAAGQRVTNAAILKQLGRGSLRDVQRHREALEAETMTAVATEDPPAVVAAPVEDPDPILQDALAALEAARCRLAAVERETQVARNQGLLLTTALRAGTITRQDPAFCPFDAAQQQLARATEVVEQAEEDLKAADRRHRAQLRAQAAAAYAQTAEGKACLEEIDRLKLLYDDAAAKELGSLASYSHMLGVERHAFQEGVSKVLATMQPEPTAAPSGPPPRLTPEMLRACYVDHDGIGREMPAHVSRFEVEDYPALLAFREVLREELAASNRTYRDLEGDEAMSAAAWHDPRTLPLRQARHKTGILHTAVQLITQDIQNVQRRARDNGQYL